MNLLLQVFFLLFAVLILSDAADPCVKYKKECHMNSSALKCQEDEIYNITTDLDDDCFCCCPDGSYSEDQVHCHKRPSSTTTASIPSEPVSKPTEATQKPTEATQKPPQSTQKLPASTEKPLEVATTPASMPAPQPSASTQKSPEQTTAFQAEETTGGLYISSAWLVVIIVCSLVVGSIIGFCAFKLGVPIMNKLCCPASANDQTAHSGLNPQSLNDETRALNPSENQPEGAAASNGRLGNHAESTTV